MKALMKDAYENCYEFHSMKEPLKSPLNASAVFIHSGSPLDSPGEFARANRHSNSVPVCVCATSGAAPRRQCRHHQPAGPTSSAVQPRGCILLFVYTQEHVFPIRQPFASQEVV